MKIALLSDIHANLAALEAVLKDCKKKKIDDVWFLGDFVGYGPFPNQVIELLQKVKAVSIVGNYDQSVLRFLEKKNKWKKKKHSSKYFSFEWTFNHLSSASKNFLTALPSQKSFQYKGITFLLVHGSPENIKEPLKENTPLERFKELGAELSQDVMICGHSHEFFFKKIDKKMFINPGSVGRSFDGNPQASYAVLEIIPKGIYVDNQRIEYPIEMTLNQMKKEKFPNDLIQSIASGKSLDTIQEEKQSVLDEKAILDQVLALARSCEYEKSHAHQVTKLSLGLYDELQSLHGLSGRYRLLLQSASLLHDIGWVKGQVRHHKTSRDIILKSFQLPLTKEERIIVALAVRYHRKALPHETHKYFSDLSIVKKVELQKIAALLRVADGLDRTHMSVIKDLNCSIKKKKIIVTVVASQSLDWEKDASYRKADLFRHIYKKDFVVHVKRK